jgi:iron complex outermembrane receptor protein
VTLKIKQYLLPLLLFASAAPAQAQSIDYAGLQTLFGEPVTTSATGKPQRVSEVPIAMEIVTADDIRRSGAQDIAEVMRAISGVNVLQSTRQQYDINIRGYNQPYSPNLLVLINGRQVYLDDYGYTVWATIPVQLKEIRQIEIVKGPNTALFGFNAAAGVINIVTMNPLYDDTSNYGVTGGTGMYRNAHYVNSTRFFDNKIGIRISGGATKADEFNKSTNGLDPNSVFTTPERHSVNFDSIIQITPKSQFRIEGSHSKVNQTEFTPYYFLSKTEHETKSLRGS